MNEAKLDERQKRVAWKAWDQSRDFPNFSVEQRLYFTVEAVLSASGLVSLDDVEKVIFEEWAACFKSSYAHEMKLMIAQLRARLSAPASGEQPAAAAASAEVDVVEDALFEFHYGDFGLLLNNKDGGLVRMAAVIAVANKHRDAEWLGVLKLHNVQSFTSLECLQMDVNRLASPAPEKAADPTMEDEARIPRREQP